MKLLKKLSASILLTFLFQSNLYAIQINPKVIKHFKNIISECSNDAINNPGEFKNNAYYVNCNSGYIKNYLFNNTVIKFEDLTPEKRNFLINQGCNFEDLKSNCKIKLLADINSSEIQQIIDHEISQPATSKRVFNNIEIFIENGAVFVNGMINLKKIPGNPLAMITVDEFIPFTSKIKVYKSGSDLNLEVLEANINSQEINEELLNIIHNWLNPLWDFSKLDFDCEIKELIIQKDSLRIFGTVF